MAKRPELLIATGPMAGTRFAVGAGGVRLGRSSSNDVHIPDEELSRNHCLFEVMGEEGIRVTDLASANGTYVNGEMLGSDPCELHHGDRIEVGATAIDVIGEPPPAAAEAVDLGLGASAGTPQDGGATARGGKRRMPAMNILWIVAVLVVAVAIAVVLVLPREPEKPVAPVPEKAEAPKLYSLFYEKVEADATRILSYRMSIDASGMLHVLFDDVPGADRDRHVDKRAKLSPAAQKRILEILDTPGFSSLDELYSGADVATENALKGFRIRVVRWNNVKDVRVENTLEPEAFRAVREALEAFSRNELGIWAIQYSREKLIELSAQSAELGDTKWEDREVEYGNLSAAVAAYREAVFYLETVNPKPEGYAELKEKLSRTEEELRRRYEDQRFRADKSINLGDWEAARSELKILCDLVPDRDDQRHAEASAKLVDVENRMKKARGGK